MNSIMIKCKKLYWERCRKNNLNSLLFRITKCVILQRPEAHLQEFSAPMYEKRGPERVLAKWPRRKNWLKNEKSQFWLDQNHFEASQCPQVLGSAQNGKTAPWAEVISGRDPESKPMHRRVLNALKPENRQKSNKKGFGNYEILWWQLKSKIEPCNAKSYRERRHMRFEHGHYKIS